MGYTRANPRNNVEPELLSAALCLKLMGSLFVTLGSGHFTLVEKYPDEHSNSMPKYQRRVTVQFLFKLPQCTGIRGPDKFSKFSRFLCLLRSC